MSRVFIVQKQMRWDATQGELTPRFNLGPAKQYGELIFLLSPTAKPFNSEPIIRELQQKLDDFSHEDYLLLVGNPCLIGWATAIAADASGGPVRMLQWNGRDNKYIEVFSNVYL